MTKPFERLGQKDDFTKKLNELNRTSFPFYNDNANYNTNSKSFYDYLARLSSLFQTLATRIWDYDEELAQRFEEWDKLIEKFPENVEKLLIEWLEDGTLEHIINVNIFKDLNKKIDDLTDKYNKKFNRFIINIDEFDGSDCEKINKALIMAHVVGGATVFVPARTYKLTCELVMYENTTLYCEKGAVLERHHTGYMLLNGVRGARYSQYNGNGNIAIINGVWDGKAQLELGGKGSNIAIAHADGVHIEGVEVINANSHSIELNSSRHVVIENSKFLGQLGSLTFVEAIQLDLSTEGGFGAFGEFDNTPCENVTIQNNVFGASKELPAVTRGIGTHSTRIGVLFNDIKVLNNEFINLRDFAIQFLCYKDSVIEGNMFYGCTGGVILYSSNPDNANHILDKYNQITTEVQPCSYITVSRNTFERITGKQVLYNYGREKSRNNNIYFKDNVVKNCTDNSGNIMMICSNDCKIDGNSVTRVNNFAIYCRNMTNVSVDNNNIEHTGNYSGIRIMEICRYITVRNNHIKRVGGNAINILTDVYSIIVAGNMIAGCNGLGEEYDAIYIHSTGGYINVNNNIMRILSGYQYESAIYITNTIDNGVRLGNVAQKGKNSEVYRTANIIDNGDVVVS